ncbi:MAG TPA: hypothetical protein VH374_26395 [Polyangia bacterium]|jgi:hypothetical protein|nr:hypothetical protein [Polyangia bacterium]
MALEYLIKTWNAVTRMIELFGGLTLNGPLVMASGGGIQQLVQPLAYVSATPVAWNVGLGAIAKVAITDAVNFSIAAPTGLLAGQLVYLTIENTSGGAFGTGTWNAIFKTTGNVPAIATGNNRTFVFYYDGTHLIEVSATAADVPN